MQTVRREMEKGTGRGSSVRKKRNERGDETGVQCKRRHANTHTHTHREGGTRTNGFSLKMRKGQEGRDALANLRRWKGREMFWLQLI